jgi:hypothetical protein
MTILQIKDMEQARNVLAVDLRDVLVVLGARASGSVWQVDGVVRANQALMVVGDAAADRLEELAQSHQRVSGVQLRKLAHAVRQVIWGEFRAYESEDERPWVIVRAIDSDSYEVETHDDMALARITAAFTDIRTQS